MENENISDVVVVEEPVPEGTPSGSDSETETTIDPTVVESASDDISASDSTLGESATEGEQTIDEKLDTIIETLVPTENETVTEETVPEDTTDYSKLLYEFMVENYTPQEEVVYTIFDKPLNDYTVSEGILFLILVAFLGKCFINVIKDTLWRW